MEDSKKVLDKSGVQKLWDKVNEYFSQIGHRHLAEDIIDLDNKLEEKQDVMSAGVGITIDEKTIINANTSATTVSPITVSNGAPIDATGIWSGNTIPSGTSVQDILMKLLCKELFPKAATKPNFTISGQGDKGVREFNSTITFNDPTTTKSNGAFNSNWDGSPSQPTVSGVSWSNETKSSVKTGFTSTESANTYIVVLGDNKITYTFKKSYSAPSNMPITNLGNPTQSTTKISTDWSDISAIWAASSITKSDNITATGVYPCFTNISGKTLTDSARTKCSLTASNVITIENAPGEDSTNNKRLIFAYPVGRTVTFKIKDLQGNYVDYKGETAESEVENYYKNTNYKILTTAGSVYLGPDNSYQLVFSKNLKQ